MTKWYMAGDYEYQNTGVEFSCTDSAVMDVFNRAESDAKNNIKIFGDMRIMQEGAKYQGVWLETQPMCAEAYASRDVEIGLNNQLIFMKYQRRDGRMPGMISYRQPWDGVAVHQDWMQGDFFTVSAFKMAFLINKDRTYLTKLYEALRDFDDYLWTYRDSDGDGCLEVWCLWDTGDDNNTRYISKGIHPRLHGPHSGENPPTDKGALPFESAEYMAYSYSHRIILAEISDILGNGEGDKWRAAAKQVQDKAIEYLWDDERKAFFDRDCDNVMMPALTLENIKCMYHGLFTQEMADEFIKRHLINPDEFWTYLPLPNIAANDPLFYVNGEINNLSPELLKLVDEVVGVESLDNSWSGAVGGLIIMRSIDALLRYGHLTEAALIGRKWIDVQHKAQKFVQQYNPMTGEACDGEANYSPSILSSLEYITYLYGVDFACDKLRWGCAKNNSNSEFIQKLFGSEFTLKHENGIAYAYKDDEMLFSVTEGVSVVTDIDGNIESVSGMEVERTDITLCVGDNKYTAQIGANEMFNIDNNELKLYKKTAFDM